MLLTSVVVWAEFREGKQGSDKTIAYMIEGIGGKADEKFPEIPLAKEIIDSRNASAFDAIHSFDNQHLSTLIPRLSEDERKYLASAIMVYFEGEGAREKIISDMVQAPYKYMVEKKMLPAVPEWVSKLNAENEGDFLNGILKEKFKESIPDFKAAIENVWKKSTEVSNEVSSESFLNYLKKHPELKEINGLIGQAHIPFLDKAGKVLKSTKTERHLLLPGNVQVRLYGGYHGDLAHLIEMAKGTAPGFIKRPVKTKTIVKPLKIDRSVCEEDAFLTKISQIDENKKNAKDSIDFSFKVGLDEKIPPAERAEAFAKMAHLKMDVELDYQEMMPSECLEEKYSSKDFASDKLAKAVQGAKTAAEMASALKDYRIFVGCNPTLDRFTRDGYPETGWIFQLVSDEPKRFGNNKCVGYWQNQVACMMLVGKMSSVEKCFTPVKLSDDIGKDCSRLELPNTAAKPSSGEPLKAEPAHPEAK